MFKPRSKQQEVIDYVNGKMGVSAVPGSGKTFTLSYLAASIVASGRLEEDQEVLVVTLVNSAVDNFSNRVASFVQERGLLPNLGYRVRTLHGLAHDVVRQRPGLVGLAEDFQIVDERSANRILEDATLAWLQAHPHVADDFLAPDLDEGKRDWVLRKPWPDLITNVARNFVRLAKDEEGTPDKLRARLERLAAAPIERTFPLVEMCTDVFSDYQRALHYRGAVDFDDLVRLALQALELDQTLLERLRAQWPYILEDEAQDSSRLQEQILRMLSEPQGNWVRVGDPNQAIYETFTTADPRLLREFREQEDVEPRELPNSGRSTPSIIALANFLIDWTRQDHPHEEVRDALAPPYIEPTPPGDPQPNPPDDPTQVRIVARTFTPAKEVQAVVDSLTRWLPDHPQETVAVLVPRNKRGFDVVSALKRRGIDYVELLRSTRSTRETAGALANVLNYLADPISARKLATVYRVWRRDDRRQDETHEQLKWLSRALSRCRQVEDFVWPRADRDWLDTLDVQDDMPQVHDQLLRFRALVQRWQEAAHLPIDQLILTLAQDLFDEPADLAIAHKLASVLRQMSETHPNWRLPDLVEELAVVARNQRRFLGLSGDDTGFDPERYRGQVVVATIHKAKGLEWDRVYLMSVNNYDFPSGQAHDQFIGEKWFIRDRINLEAEALAQLEAVLAEGTLGIYEYEERNPTEEARRDYVAERLRLLYVGITRAKTSLIVTWNTGRRGDLQPAAPFLALHTFWEEGEW